VIQDKLLIRLELSAIQQLCQLSADVSICRPTKIRRVTNSDWRGIFSGTRCFALSREGTRSEPNHQHDDKQEPQGQLRFIY
jgi:hypothetical protein